MEDRAIAGSRNCANIDIQKREQLIQQRKADAAVLADVPQTPGAEEFSKSEDAEGKVSKDGGVALA